MRGIEGTRVLWIRLKNTGQTKPNLLWWSSP